MIDKVVRSMLALAFVSSLGCNAFAESADSEDYKKADELIGKKSFGEAIPLLDKAIKADPKHAEAYMDRALCNFHEKNYKKVVEDCKEVAGLESAHEVTKRQAYMMSAGAQNALGEYDAAIQSCGSAIALAPHASLCFTDRAFAYQNLKKYDEALRDVNEAIKLDPKHASNYELRAAVYEALARQDRNKHAEMLKNHTKPSQLGSSHL
ncbi:MAG: tetratricopeptide repeat protein [Candidatus Obscuribacterales bacterium]|nr:tetratricopeptide repeat protein [Candidatus Obscuribacterales bacterium]